ncbi:hypothetical protein TSUD_206060 [Trifolium subterraneum]|uniref:Uncharacterized protein n=1 Tax=Trifolium subterraneum TaxID=3900 RepID=A0A2Z6NDR3_TRISU|nr:hypothetical protein TSUD_206060 [Trifolium subterraneum]
MKLIKTLKTTAIALFLIKTLEDDNRLKRRRYLDNVKRVPRVLGVQWICLWIGGFDSTRWRHLTGREIEETN